MLQRHEEITDLWILKMD